MWPIQHRISSYNNANLEPHSLISFFILSPIFLFLSPPLPPTIFPLFSLLTCVHTHTQTHTHPLATCTVICPGTPLLTHAHTHTHTHSHTPTCTVICPGTPLVTHAHTHSPYLYSHLSGNASLWNRLPLASIIVILIGKPRLLLGFSGWTNFSSPLLLVLVLIPVVITTKLLETLTGIIILCATHYSSQHPNL